MGVRRHSVPVLAAAALAACAAAWPAPALAQSPGKGQPAPGLSTKLSVGESEAADAPAPSGLAVDFGRPAGADEVQPAAADAPKEAESAADDHAGHACVTGDRAVDEIVRQAGGRYGVDPCLIVAVMSQESGFRRYAISPKGACGYMQLMPDTARRFGVTDIFDPQQNIFAAAQYLRFLLDRFDNNLDLTLAGYNAGENAVERYGRLIPPFVETQNYVRVISERYLRRHSWLTKPASTQAAAPSASPVTPPASPSILVEFAKPE
jgi:soluble lytic murein transglycosylase-like protein